MLAVQINPGDRADMVLVPAGEFLMGSDDSDYAKPQHGVYLDDYWIYKMPVTVAQYRKFCEATQRAMPDAPSWSWKDDHPAVNVTWHDARAYCEWTGVGLPTEAQWEKAARGTGGRKYPWGDRWDVRRCANSVGRNNLASTLPVGSYPSGASPYGCLDMAGNVWEWCADWFGRNYYQCGIDRNPPGPEQGMYRVLRGGSWFDYGPGSFRCAHRYGFAPDVRYSYFGFRCVSCT